MSLNMTSLHQILPLSVFVNSLSHKAETTCKSAQIKTVDKNLNFTPILFTTRFDQSVRKILLDVVIMRLGAIFLCCIFGLSHGQFDFPNPYSAEQCASKLACSMNYSKVFDSKISELTYHHNLDLYKLRSFFVEKINPIEQDTEILKMNTSAMLQSFGREITNIYTTLSHDRDFINNLTHGIYDLGKSLHSEISIRMDDVHRLVVELRGVQNNLALLQSQIDQLRGGNSTVAVPQIIQQTGNCKGINNCRGNRPRFQSITHWEKTICSIIEALI